MKAINDTMGTNGLVPSFLVFGTITSFPAPPLPQTTQEERLSALHMACSKVETIVAENGIITTLRSKLPPATKYLMRPSDKVRVYFTPRK